MDGKRGNPEGYDGRILRDKGICGGEPVFKGTRVTLRTVLASLADGNSIGEILADFPSLKPDDVQAAIAFAAASAEEDLPVPEAPHIRSKSSWTRTSPRLASRLKEFGHDVHTVHEERLIGHVSPIVCLPQK
jgi:uncharacterized protein (DUF433 family)